MSKGDESDNMLSITTKAQYGIQAIIELARNHGQGLVKLKDIVARKEIPRNYLVQIFGRLHKQGIIKSTRGKNGGYELAEHPDNISLLRVFEALEGELRVQSTRGPAPVDELFGEIVQLAKKTLDVPLSEILLRQAEYERHLMFHI
jgi:Rrf2 family cysteine metabolism transcriptional repressor